MQGGPKAQAVVRDSGDGARSEFLQQYSPLSPRPTAVVQTGAWLARAVDRDVVTKHRRTMRAIAMDRQGATFTLTIPCREKLVGGIHHSRERGGQNLSGIRVLVVDDDAGARQLMSKALEAFGAVVHECSSAREAYAVLPQWTPDILVSDLAMPEEDGYSLIRRVRESGSLVPAVAVTAYARSEDEARVREAGFQRHVPKPFDPQILVEAVPNSREREAAAAPARGTGQ